LVPGLPRGDQDRINRDLYLDVQEGFARRIHPEILRMVIARSPPRILQNEPLSYTIWDKVSISDSKGSTLIPHDPG